MTYQLARRYVGSLLSEEVAGVLRSCNRAELIGTSTARPTVAWVYSDTWGAVCAIEREKAHAR